jgi:hypothetical protein
VDAYRSSDPRGTSRNCLRTTAEMNTGQMAAKNKNQVADFIREAMSLKCVCVDDGTGRRVAARVAAQQLPGNETATGIELNETRGLETRKSVCHPGGKAQGTGPACRTAASMSRNAKARRDSPKNRDGLRSHKERNPVL